MCAAGSGGGGMLIPAPVPGEVAGAGAVEVGQEVEQDYE